MSRKGKSTVGGLEESDGEDSNEEEMSCSQESVSSQKSLVREISRAALSSPPKKSRLNDDVPKNRPSVKQHESKFSGESIRGKRRQNCLNPAKVPSLTEDPFGSAFPEIQLTTATSLPSTEAEIDISASDALPQMQSSLSESSVLTRKIFTEPKKVIRSFLNLMSAQVKIVFLLFQS